MAEQIKEVKLLVKSEDKEVKVETITSGQSVAQNGEGTEDNEEYALTVKNKKLKAKKQALAAMVAEYKALESKQILAQEAVAKSAQLLFDGYDITVPEPKTCEGEELQEAIKQVSENDKKKDPDAETESLPEDKQEDAKSVEVKAIVTAPAP